MKSISSLKIENFRGLHNTLEINFKKINVIASPGNFGKTSLLQAIVTSMNYDNGNQILYTASLFKKSKCRDYDMLRQLLYKDENFYSYSLCAKFHDIEIKKKLKGVFIKNNQKFIGNYEATLESGSFNTINKTDREIYFVRDVEVNYIDSEICSPKIMYFDFETGCECELNDFTNENIRAYLKGFMNRFDMDIKDAFIKNRKYRINHKQNGIMTADSYGTAFKRIFEFANYCDKTKGDVLIIENADCFCAKESYSAFADFLVSVSCETKCQTFFSVRSRDFGKIIVQNAMNSLDEENVNYIDIYKDEDEIKIKN